MVQQVAESSSGDASSRVSAFYNYHSMPILSSGIDNLIKFVSSQLSISLLQLFFCCDVRATPSDILFLVEKIPNCEIVHINLTSKDLFEQQISARIVKLSSTSSDQLVLISDTGNYSLDSAGGLEYSELVVFHPPSADIVFEGISTIRSIELPVTVEEVPPQAIPKPVVPVPSQLLHELNDHKQHLEMVVGRLTKMNAEIISHACQEVKMLKTRLADMEEKLKKMRQSLKMVERETLEEEKKQEVEEQHVVEVEEVCEENSYTEDDGQEDDSNSGRQHNISPSTGNGWDSFPDPEKLSSAQGNNNGWDEVDKEMETEQRQECRPGFGANPFQQRKNPFGNPLDCSQDQAPVQHQPRQQQQQQSLNLYNQDLYEDPSIAYNGGAKNYNEFQSKGRGGKSFRPQENNPFHFGGPAQQYPRVGRNPFSRGPGGPMPVPIPNSGFQQLQPTRGYDASGAEMTVSQEGGFKKPAPQCPQWENRAHRAAGSCQLWHPHKQCRFFPKCRATAGGCGYAHPFCTEGVCQCEGEMKDPQLNHFFADE